jgi:hypothetical protein
MERRITTGNRTPNWVMEALLPHMFDAQMWTFDYLEYVRKRVEAIERGEDPECIEAPAPDATATDA